MEEYKFIIIYVVIGGLYLVWNLTTIATYFSNHEINLRESKFFSLIAVLAAVIWPLSILLILLKNWMNSSNKTNLDV